MSDSKKKYEDTLADEAQSGLTAALAAASKARHQERAPDEPDVPEPGKVESPAPDEIEEMAPEEISDIRKDILEIRKMIETNNRKLNQILSRFSALNNSKRR